METVHAVCMGCGTAATGSDADAVNAAAAHPLIPNPGCPNPGRPRVDGPRRSPYEEEFRQRNGYWPEHQGHAVAARSDRRPGPDKHPSRRPPRPSPQPGESQSSWAARMADWERTYL